MSFGFPSKRSGFRNVGTRNATRSNHVPVNSGKPASNHANDPAMKETAKLNTLADFQGYLEANAATKKPDRQVGMVFGTSSPLEVRGSFTSTGSLRMPVDRSPWELEGIYPSPIQLDGVTDQITLDKVTGVTDVTKVTEVMEQYRTSEDQIFDVECDNDIYSDLSPSSPTELADYNHSLLHVSDHDSYKYQSTDANQIQEAMRYSAGMHPMRTTQDGAVYHHNPVDIVSLQNHKQNGSEHESGDVGSDDMPDEVSISETCHGTEINSPMYDNNMYSENSKLNCMNKQRDYSSGNDESKAADKSNPDKNAPSSRSQPGAMRWRGTRRPNTNTLNSRSEVPQKDNAKKAESTKFGSVRVNAAVLSPAVDSKTYVITDRTTAKELVSIVLTGYKAVCENQQLFYLCLDRKNRKPKHEFTADVQHESSSSTSSASTSLATTSSSALADSDKPLEIQNQYPDGETRFRLLMKSETGMITVRDKCINPTRSCHSVFITNSATCRQVLELIVKTHKCLKNVEDFVLFEVDPISKVSNELCPKSHPLEAQAQWSNKYECFFETRQKSESSGTDGRQIRRSRSVEEALSQQNQQNDRDARRNTLQTSQQRSRALTNDTANEVTAKTNGSRDPSSRLRVSLRQIRHNLVDQKRRKPVRAGSRGPRTDHVSRSDAESSERRTRSLSREKKPQQRAPGSKLPLPSRGRQRRNSDTQTLNDRTLQELLNQTKRGLRKRTEVTTSNESLSAWERRKMYDVQRKRTGSADVTDTNDDVSRSRKSSASSTTSSGPKFRASRRSLPQVPGANSKNTDANDRKHKITQKALEKVRLAKFKLEQAHLGGSENISGYSDNNSFGVGADFDSTEEHKSNKLNIQCIEDSALRPESDISGYSDAKSSTPRETHFQPLHPHPLTETVIGNSKSQGLSQEISHTSWDTFPSSTNSPPQPTHKTNPSNSSFPQEDGDRGRNTTPVYCSSTSNGYTNSYQPLHNNNSLSSLSHHGKGISSSPSLHQLLKTCDLHFVTVESTSCDIHISSVIDIEESVYAHNSSDLKSKKSISTVSTGTRFGQSQGFMHALGQSGSAFLPVGGKMRSVATNLIIAVRSIDRNIMTETEGRLQEGDYIIEVQGTPILNRPVNDFWTLLDECDGPLELVVARPKNSGHQITPTQNVNTIHFQKELEKSKIRYESLQLESERYMDMVADMKLMLQSRDDVIHSLELDLGECQGRLSRLIDWSNSQDIGISREKLGQVERQVDQLKKEVKVKDKEIMQLETLLAQQVEVLEIERSGTKAGHFLEYDYEGAHVSAV